MVTYVQIKRTLDFVGALFGIAILSPLLLATAFLVLVNLGLPLTFSQKRPGRDGRIFTLYKFRSMKAIQPSRGAVDDAQRMNAFGRRFRSTSLDELPSLINVLRGHMSFVGPRPLLVEYLPRYSERQLRRHDVRPGITGLAQVSGRNAIEWNQKFILDVEYVENSSFRLDAHILIKTLTSLFDRKGISADGHATMPLFLGNPSSGDPQTSNERA